MSGPAGAGRGVLCLWCFFSSLAAFEHESDACGDWRGVPDLALPARGSFKVVGVTGIQVPDRQQRCGGAAGARGGGSVTRPPAAIKFWRTMRYDQARIAARCPSPVTGNGRDSGPRRALGPGPGALTVTGRPTGRPAGRLGGIVTDGMLRDCWRLNLAAGTLEHSMSASGPP